METVLNVAASGAVSLSRTDSKSQKTDDSAKSSKDVEDTIDLSVGLDLSERIRNAKDSDEVVALLKEGQEEARAAVAKFKALQEERLHGKGANEYAKAADHLFDSVRKAVVDLLSEQGKPNTSSVPFDVRLSQYLNGDKT